MSRIFISYSSRSKESVRTLAQDLGEIGHQVWFDHKLTGGKEWWDQILEQIRQCDLFVFALTPDALDSVPCEREYRYAYALDKNILPVLLADGVSINLLPPELTVIQFVDYRQQNKEAAFRLMTALSGIPPARPIPMQLPEPPGVPISYEGELKIQIESQNPLSFDEQSAILLKLKTKLDEYQQSQSSLDDIRELLRRFKKRDDLFAKIDREIDGLIRSVQSVPSNPAPVASVQSSVAPPIAAAAPPPAMSPPAPLLHSYTAMPATQATGGAAYAAGVAFAKVRPALWGWALAGLITSVSNSAIMVSDGLYYILTLISVCIAGAVAGHFTFSALQNVIPALHPDLRKRMTVGIALAWLAGALASMLLESVDSSFFTRAVLHVIEGGIVTVTVLGVLHRVIASLFPQIKRSVIIAWALGYFVMFMIYTLVDPMLIGLIDRAYITRDLTPYFMWSIVFIMIANAVGATIGTWLTIRAVQKLQGGQSYAPLPHLG